MDEVSQAGGAEIIEEQEPRRSRRSRGGDCKEEIKRKKWKFTFLSSMTTEDFLDAFKKESGKKEKKDRNKRRPLYESASGLIIDKRTNEVRLYLEKQLTYRVLTSYPYVKTDSIEVGDVTTEGFQQRLKHYKHDDNFLVLNCTEEDPRRQKNCDSDADSKTTKEISAGSSFLFSKLQAKQYKKVNQKSLPLEFQYLLEKRNC